MVICFTRFPNVFSSESVFFFGFHGFGFMDMKLADSIFRLLVAYVEMLWHKREQPKCTACKAN